VNVYGWLAPGEMVRGLALAETTPGPLIMVVQFVAFVGAYRAPGDLNPWVAALIASLLAKWVTFVPCFLFILLGAPYVERLRGNRALSTTLTGITAAVVGVIASLVVFFALHTLFADTTRVTAGLLDFEFPVLGLNPVGGAGHHRLGVCPHLLARLVGPPHVGRVRADRAVVSLGLQVF
jgi:chromate transporter